MHRKNLAKRINTMLTILLLLLLIPLFLTIFCQKMQLEELLGNVNRTAETEEDADMLFCIVAKEISADAPEECIKAQCVIASRGDGDRTSGEYDNGRITGAVGRLFFRGGREDKGGDTGDRRRDAAVPEPLHICGIPCSECGQYKKYGRIISGFGYALSFRCGML